MWVSGCVSLLRCADTQRSLRVYYWGGVGISAPENQILWSWEGWNSFQAELLQATNPLSPLFPISINPPVYPLFPPLSPQLMLFYFIETLPDWRQSTGKPQGKRKNRREKAEGNYMVWSVYVMSPNLENYNTSNKSEKQDRRLCCSLMVRSVILRNFFSQLHHHKGPPEVEILVWKIRGTEFKIQFNRLSTEWKLRVTLFISHIVCFWCH